MICSEHLLLFSLVFGHCCSCRYRRRRVFHKKIVVDVAGSVDVVVTVVHDFDDVVAADDDVGVVGIVAVASSTTKNQS